jgi:putative CocE/NonD family hydrolase
VTGAERWRAATSLEAITAGSQALFLGSTGSASDLYASGALATERRGAAAFDRYLYDPRDISIAAVEAAVDPDSMIDTQVTAARTSKLVYHSDPFPADTELSGFFRFVAFIGIDQPDTDFYVEVSEVGLDGSVIPLATDAIRARYRESASRPTLVTSRAALRYDFNHFTFASRLVKKGSRLRLVIHAGDSIFVEKNYNAGGVVAAESVKDARPVIVTLYHDAAHPSALYIPKGVPESTSSTH